MVTKTIHSKAPTRIDLAGGTVDIWPLYLFLDRPVTLNLGIDLFAEARIECAAAEGARGKATLKSEDQGHELRFAWDELSGVYAPPSLELHLKLLRYFARERAASDSAYIAEDFTLSTKARSPAGAGLGGSSTLSIAMVGALATWARGQAVDPAADGEKFIEIVRDVETTVIKVPAGMQDYYGAMYGGLQSLKWGFGTHRREWLDDSLLSELESRILLFYSGQSRNSGINNWALFKGFIDNEQSVREKFAKIAAATRKLDEALRKGDWVLAGKAISEEWETRRTLAPGISTPEMDQAFARARDMAMVSGKVCGAGGGGCFFVYHPHPNDDHRERIRQAFVELGMRPLPFKAVPRGLEVSVTGGT